MAEAKKCDGCGTFFDIDDFYLKFNIIKSENRWQTLPEEFELCEKCVRKFENFVKGLGK